MKKELYDEINKDIEKCKQKLIYGKSGSQTLFESLIAKYTTFYKDFEKGIKVSGKAVSVGSEFDYLPEIKNIAAKLEALLIQDPLELDILTEQERAKDFIINCRNFIANSNPDENEIERFYREFTAFFGDRIKNFGDCIYNYHKEQNFYSTNYMKSNDIQENLRILIVRAEEYYVKTFSKDVVKKSTDLEYSTRDAFIVHGHNEEIKDKTELCLKALGLNPIILHKQANEGKTIIEKLEKHSDVGFAIVLLTDDDEGKNKTEKEYKPRARQNVILEMGWFMGKLGRSRLFLLYTDGVEVPSDYDGVLYTPYDKNGAWKFDLVRELQAAGYKVDANKLI